MSRITKHIASEMAKKLGAKSLGKLETLRDETEESIRGIIYNRLPAEVVDLEKKFPKYLNTDNSYHPTYKKEFGSAVFYFKEAIPSPIHNGYSSKSISLLPKNVADLDKLAHKYAKAETAHKALIQKLEDSLYALRTYKKVTEQFPEAVKYLPKVKREHSIALSLVELRKLV